MPVKFLDQKLQGVNERALPTNSVGFNALEGLYFPDLGAIARIPGKFLLQKFDAPVWSIYQFWTPYGIIVGLFQFEDDLGTDPWRIDDWRPSFDPFGFPEIPIDIPVIPGASACVSRILMESVKVYDSFNPPVFHLENVYLKDDTCIVPLPTLSPETPSGIFNGSGKRCIWETDETEIPITFTDGGQFSYNQSTAVLESITLDPPVPLFDYAPLPALPIAPQVFNAFGGVSRTLVRETIRQRVATFPPDPVTGSGGIRLDTTLTLQYSKGIIDIADFVDLDDTSIALLALKIEIAVEGLSPQIVYYPLVLEPGESVIEVDPNTFAPAENVIQTCQNHNIFGIRVACSNPSGNPLDNALRGLRSANTLVITDLVMVVHRRICTYV